MPRDGDYREGEGNDYLQCPRCSRYFRRSEMVTDPNDGKLVCESDCDDRPEDWSIEGVYE